ncbi:MAG TPA: hypothetical protein PLT66_03820, partial [Bacillota bacterium]|nr:hypothetical protein [Bacillota bacterium]
MKKVITVLLSLVIILSLVTLTSCDEDVYEQYKAAMDKTSALTSYDVSFNAIIGYVAGGTSLNTTTEGNI